MNTFFWHDYETFGANPRRDRPAQFAGWRTDEELEPVEEPVVWFCRPPEDYLPEPEACLVTGITPQQALREGCSEREFAALIHEQLARPQTCSVGYNSIRFDDEFTRFLLYRNFFEPYDREWRDGNSRWDLIDLARLCYALRPQGIEWPEHEPGKPSFRLEDLAQANRLTHARAHDALSDVEVTVELARLIRSCQPRLFAYALSLRDKRTAAALLDFARMEPVLHASSRFPAERGCISIVAPVCPHPLNGNGIIVFDLASDPAELNALDVEDIRDRVFTPRADLPEEVERIPLKVVHTNRSPMLAPLSVLKGVDLARIALDPDRCEAHLQRLRQIEGLRAKLSAVFDQAYEDAQPAAEEALYSGGFLSQGDRALLVEVRSSPGDRLGEYAASFSDPRMRELLFRFRARNHADTLNATEREDWQRWCRQQIEALDEHGLPRHEALRRRIDALRDTHAGDAHRLEILDQLDAFVADRTRALGIVAPQSVGPGAS